MPKGTPKKKTAKPAEPAKPLVEQPLIERNQVAKSTDVVWEPKPDMGDIKPPADAEKTCANCEHKKAVHYGSTRDWCNTQGCNCQGFK